jgi:hypothetical protein
MLLRSWMRLDWLILMYLNYNCSYYIHYDPLNCDTLEKTFTARQATATTLQSRPSVVLKGINPELSEKRHVQDGGLRMLEANMAER